MRRTQSKAVDELARLYKLVRQLVDYHAAIAELPKQRAASTHARRNSHGSKPKSG